MNKEAEANGYRNKSVYLNEIKNWVKACLDIG